jgi:hypothetical protein
MIFPAHTVFRAARQPNLQIAVYDEANPLGMYLIPDRRQAKGPDVVATPCNDPEFIDVNPRTDDGRILLQLLLEKK